MSISLSGTFGSLSGVQMSATGLSPPPPQTYYSNLFDGNGDYLTIPDNIALDVEASNFTIECWYYPNTSITGIRALFSKRASYLIYGGISVYFNNNLTPRMTATNSGSNWEIDSGSSIGCNLNQWNHIALVRNANSWRLYVNGQVGINTSMSGTVPNNSAAFAIGATAADGKVHEAINSSYISNFRIVKGTAVYTSAFTPPTAPLTAISGTSLLTCQSATIVDNSPNNFPITVSGDVAVSTQNPFN